MVVLFSQQYGEGKKPRGYGYAFNDEFGFSVEYNAEESYGSTCGLLG